MSKDTFPVEHLFEQFFRSLGSLLIAYFVFYLFMSFFGPTRRDLDLIGSFVIDLKLVIVAASFWAAKSFGKQGVSTNSLLRGFIYAIIIIILCLLVSLPDLPPF